MLTNLSRKQLLIKFIETHDISVDPKKISEAWPAENEDARPTPRAITERIHKIRALAKATAAKNGTSAPTTPASRKRGPRGSKSSTKRSRTGGPKKDTSGENGSPRTPTPANNGGPVKKETTDENLVSNGELEDMFTHRPLGKRVRTNPALPLGMIKYERDTDEEDAMKYESSVSEFAPADGDDKDDDDFMDDLIKDEIV
ncbi:TPA_exp: Uncharacterized protein A8136_6827 [Trichophyton benhamiae CBS 112371]|uniref:Uncharacterized protein n=1 Tax=Arthroderma benhamiae (strain ATCC MYA-4681 / CBS 112371) TaxID=663331 RepID=D4AS21_ARTBC|nr:uncharacterized protein ARB_07036 [Trichophyton benhamiae CBS 112371]EFE34085.1 conserved hypothetical protein [Trichophyton benhamiae CBS 112371]DAA77061.1 TPA_exp: Uncharacterized protein A8136_6827 [Trichophyton benhamiae CBS 112371]